MMLQRIVSVKELAGARQLPSQVLKSSYIEKDRIPDNHQGIDITVGRGSSVAGTAMQDHGNQVIGYRRQKLLQSY